MRPRLVAAAAVAVVAVVMTGATAVAQASATTFEGVLRKFLAAVEADHGRVDSIDLFPAVGVSAAVTIGRVLMPHVSPAWNIHDRGSDGRFFPVLRVQR